MHSGAAFLITGTSPLPQLSPPDFPAFASTRLCGCGDDHRPHHTRRCHQAPAASFIVILITRPLLFRFGNFRRADFLLVEAAAIIIAAKIPNQSGIGFSTATGRVCRACDPGEMRKVMAAPRPPPGTVGLASRDAPNAKKSRAKPTSGRGVVRPRFSLVAYRHGCTDVDHRLGPIDTTLCRYLGGLTSTVLRMRDTTTSEATRQLVAKRWGTSAAGEAGPKLAARVDELPAAERARLRAALDEKAKGS